MFIPNTLVSMSYFTLHEFIKTLSPDELNTVANNTVYFDRLVYFREFLNILRVGVGQPIYINSWFRSVEHNKRCGGVSASAHLTGSAVDVSCDDNLKLLHELFIGGGLPVNAFGQVIFYPVRHFIHLALPSDKYPESTLFVNFGENHFKRFDVVSDYLQ